MLVAGGVLLVDQVTKFLVIENIPLRTSMPVISDFVRLTHIRNPGVAFGLLGDKGIPFVLVSLVAMVLIVVSLGRVPPTAHLLRFSLASILGGASGNLIDRIRFREVVDFIEIGIGSLRWPVFNVADVAVTTGVCLFLVGSLRGRRDQESVDSSGESGAEDEASPASSAAEGERDEGGTSLRSG